MSGEKYNYTNGQGNITVQDGSQVTSNIDSDEILSHDQMIYIMRILMFGVTPFVACMGVTGNVFSIIILRKHGLHKCSNILLLCLAVTDLTFLVAFNSVPKILYDLVGVASGYAFSKDVSWGLFIIFHVFNILDYGMCYSSLTMPMLITFERLVAVYLPFKFNRIITPRRTWSAVAVVYLFWYTIVVYMSNWWNFDYLYDPKYNISVGKMIRSPLFHKDQSNIKAIELFLSTMSMKIPPIFTLVGCIFISVKVKMASSRRKKMTQAAASKESSSNRTTKMLLAVCVVYMCTCVVLSLPDYIPKYAHHTLLNDATSNLSPVMYQIINIAVCINSSANFLVYVVMNKNFRDTYKSLFTNCCRGQGS